jgi:hypothetical protein
MLLRKPLRRLRGAWLVALPLILVAATVRDVIDPSFARRVSGLARDEDAAAMLRSRDIEAVVGDLADVQLVFARAAWTDGVIHVAVTGDERQADVDVAVTTGMLDSLAGSGSPYVHTSGGWVLGHTGARPANEDAPIAVAEPITAVAFLRRAVKHYANYGITVERLITDNGSAYRSTMHAIACRALGIRHLRTRPYRPQTNGKAERFIRTMLGGWAYGAIYQTSTDRTAALDGWLWHYNHQRRHSALGHQPPITRTNLLGSYS